jgi:prepilin peptidase CpaA
VISLNETEWIGADMTFASSVPVMVVLFASGVAAFTDVRRFKVYNKLTYPLCLGGLVFAAFTAGQQGFLDSLTGVLLGFGVLLLPYMLGALGAGDVKFVAAVGAWLELDNMFLALLVGVIACGVYSLVLIVKHRRYQKTWTDMKLIFLRLAVIGRQFGREDDIETVQQVASHDDRRERLVPFSAMITIGIVATIAWRFWVAN